MEIHERLFAWRVEQMIEREDLCKEIGVSLTQYKDIESGYRQMTFIVLRKLVETYNLDANWLITGQGRNIEDTIEGVVRELNETWQEKYKQLVEHYTQLLQANLGAQ